MINVKVYKQSNYPVSTPKIKKFLKEFFIKQGIVSDAQISLALVNETEMLKLASQYLKEKNVLHNVLSFPAQETRGKFLMADAIDLGEIVVCYPVAFAEAKKENKLIETKIEELVEHGAWHLLGKHHR